MCIKKRNVKTCFLCASCRDACIFCWTHVVLVALNSLLTRCVELLCF